jgi:predicted metal-dependent hydrolase
MQFEYEIKYSKRKTLNITVERDRKIIVRAPENTSPQKIEEVLQSKKQWLKEKATSRLGTKFIFHVTRG